MRSSFCVPHQACWVMSHSPSSPHHVCEFGFHILLGGLFHLCLLAFHILSKGHINFVYCLSTYYQVGHITCVHCYAHCHVFLVLGNQLILLFLLIFSSMFYSCICFIPTSILVTHYNVMIGTYSHWIPHPHHHNDRYNKVRMVELESSSGSHAQ